MVSPCPKAGSPWIKYHIENLRPLSRLHPSHHAKQMPIEAVLMPSPIHHPTSFVDSQNVYRGQSLNESWECLEYDGDRQFIGGVSHILTSPHVLVQ